ncbi:EAL domain-containing response regulator [Pseudoalteromonas sp. G4]|uniref:EAL domain-containing response regulator n=1 Tax=Pseudoalteromonas sp. G4 TaxID=2992761 RepID=UPI00237E8F29|nr:EAL domain-containing response regulator [Pseudoalteromonas sp. G4]MDE3270500.1 EAL domain-containing response regulator [Pseudoalteromonas sp. G4]
MHKNLIRIAIVDDSKTMLLTLKAMLNGLGYPNIETFSSARLAFGIVEKDVNAFHCILTDLNMPEYDGMAFIRQLGEIGYPGGVAIVSEMDERVIALAADLAKIHHIRLIGNLSKPVSIKQIEMVLDRLSTLNVIKQQTLQYLSEQELIDAIENQQIEPYYQPKINSITNRVESLEILARIVKPGHIDAILPQHFLPTAVALGIENIVTFQLVEKAARHYSELKVLFDHDFKLAINLSPKQMQDYFCAQQMATILCVNGLEPNQFIIEVTEEYALRTPEQLETLNRLRMSGYGIALDDFGTGFTNLNQLRTLPFTEIKIDRSFISSIRDDKFSQVIVKSLIDVAKEQKVELVAEGVEDVEDLEYLQKSEIGILLQGFFICRPKPIKEVIRWYAKWKQMTETPL